MTQPAPAQLPVDGSAASFRAAMARSWLRILLSSVVGLAALWLAMRQVDPPTLWATLGQVHWSLVALSALLLTVVIAVRVYRWRILLAPVIDLDRFSLARIGTIGLLMIFALPLRLGEFVRPLLLRRATGVPLSTGMATIAVERVLDGVVVVLLFFVSLQLAGTHQPPPAAMAAAWGALVLFGGGAVMLVAARLWQDQVTSLLRRLLGLISAALAQKIIGIVEAFCMGLEGLSLGQFARYIGWTAAFWICNAMGYYVLLLAFPFGADIPLTAAFTTVGVIVFAILIPGPPGFLGPFQLGLVVGLGIYGVSETQANAFGVILYPLTALLQFLAALPFLLLPPRPSTRYTPQQ